MLLYIYHFHNIKYRVFFSWIQTLLIYLVDGGGWTRRFMRMSFYFYNRCVCTVVVTMRYSLLVSWERTLIIHSWRFTIAELTNDFSSKIQTRKYSTCVCRFKRIVVTCDIQCLFTQSRTIYLRIQVPQWQSFLGSVRVDILYVGLTFCDCSWKHDQ